jgi:plastocyanin
VLLTDAIAKHRHTRSQLGMLHLVMQKVLRSLSGWIALSWLFVMSACGGGPSGPTTDIIVTITANGVTPTEVRVAAFGQVTFLNNDARPHAMSSDPVSGPLRLPARQRRRFPESGAERDDRSAEPRGYVWLPRSFERVRSDLQRTDSRRVVPYRPAQCIQCLECVGACFGR